VARRKGYQQITIKPPAGGSLAPAMSEELAGNPANYEVKLNFRREHDFETRREGWEFFRPFKKAPWIPNDEINYHEELELPFTLDATLPSEVHREELKGQSLISGETILSVGQFESSERVTVACTQSDIFLLNRDPTSEATKHSNRYWEIVDGKGYTEIFDNPMDDYVSEVVGYEEHRDSVDAWTKVTPKEFKLSPKGNRMDIVHMYDHVLFNNGRDLPLAFHSDWTNVHPVYELRENGIVSAKIMSEYNGYLLLGNVVEFKTVDDHAAWNTFCRESQYPVYGCVEDSEAFANKSVRVHRVPFRVLYSNPGAPTRWGVTAKSDTPHDHGSSAITVDKTYHVQDQDLAFPRQLEPTFYPGCKVRIQAIDSADGTAMRLWNYRKIVGSYVQEGKTTYVLDKPLNYKAEFRVPNPNYAAPVDEEIPGSGVEGSSSEDAGAGEVIHRSGFRAQPEPTQPVTAPGDVRILRSAINTGDGNTIRVENTEDEYITVVDFSDMKANLIMERADHVTQNNSQVVEGTGDQYGFSMQGGVNNISNFFDLTGDGSALISMEKLKNRLVVFRDTGYGILSPFAPPDITIDAPFTYELRYTGARVPIDHFTAVAINDRTLIYTGKEDLFAISVSFSEPEIPMPLDLAKEFGYGDTFYLVDNVLTSEIFICGSRKTLAYDYKFNSVSEIDAVFTCATSLKSPVTGLNNFVMGIRTPIDLEQLRMTEDVPHLAPRGCALFKYSYDEPSDQELSEYDNTLVDFDPSGQRSYVREVIEDGQIVGRNYESVLESGWIDFGDRMNEKDYRMYVMSFQSDPTDFYMKTVTSEEVLGLSLPFELPRFLTAVQSKTFVEDRVALSEDGYELEQSPRLRLLVDESFHLNVKLYSRDSVGGVHRLEVDEVLTDRDEVAIPVFFRSVFLKDRVAMTGVSSGRVFARSLEAQLIESRGRILSVDR